MILEETLIDTVFFMAYNYHKCVKETEYGGLW